MTYSTPKTNRRSLKLSRSVRLASACAIAAALGLGADDAEAQQLRFSTTAPGGIASTGNTLGLAKAYDENGPGTEHSIGTFTSLDPNSVDDEPYSSANPWPHGTTWDWTLNGSTGALILPAGAEVLHAELVWAGSHGYWPEDVSHWLNEPVTMLAGGQEIEVIPDPGTAQTLAEQSYTGFWANYYLRSADVTAFVAQHGATTYGVSGVPATQNELTNTLSGAGWSLVVAYRHDASPIRNLSLFVGGSFVDEDSQQDYSVAGFCAPPFGEVEGSVIISALEGDANLTGEDLAIGASPDGNFVSLSGPNNPENNFFCSQVNGPDGEVDKNGTFGERNHDAHNGVNVAGARQGWDLTTVAISSSGGHLANDQKAAVLRTSTYGDSYFPVLAAIELDVKSPDFSDSITEASREAVELGEAFTVVATLKNTGEAQASHLSVVLPIDNGLVVTGFTMDGQPGDANGAPVTATELATGVEAGTLMVDETRTIEIAVEVVGPPDNGTQYIFAPDWSHRFQMCTNDPAIAESYAGPDDQVQYLADQTGGEGGSPPVGTGGGDAAPVFHEQPEEMGECGCRVVGHNAPAGSAAGLALLALAAGMGLRRRRNG